MAENDDRRDDDRRDDDRRDDDRRDDDRRDDDRNDDTGGTGTDADRERQLAGEAARYRRQLRDAERRVHELELASKSDNERAIAEAVRKREDELTVAHRRELVGLRVQVAAASKLRDPADATAHLDLDELVEHADDPRELERAVGRAVDELLERKPYLGREADDDGRRGLRDVVTAGRQGDDRDRGRGDDPDAWLRSGRDRR